MTEHLNEIVSLLLFCIGLYGLAARRNIIKTIISLGVMELSVILFFLSLSVDFTQRPPIAGTDPANMVDPLPQALMITAIVIGISVTAVTLTLFITMYHHYGTTNWDKAREMNRKGRRHD